MINYGTIPIPRMREPIRLWIEDRVCTNTFLIAVLQNDLFTAIDFADEIEINQLSQMIIWLYSNAPIGSFGSKTLFDQYARQRGNLK